MSTVKTTTGKKKRQEQTTPFLRTGMPFIVQWCRNVKDAECPPDTLLCARGRVSSLHSAAITRLSSGRQGEAHPQRDLQKTWSSREPERFLFGSDLIICQPRECVCVCMLLYIYISICEEDIPGDAGVGSLQPGHKPLSSAAAPCEARSSQSTTVSMIRCALIPIWSSDTAENDLRHYNQHQIISSTGIVTETSERMWVGEGLRVENPQ